MAQLKFEFLFSDKKQRMAQSHDELIANIVLNYSKPQKVYMIDHRQNDTKYMGHLDKILKKLFSEVVFNADQMEKEDEEDEFSASVLAYYNANGETYPDDEWKLIFIKALKSGMFEYGNWYRDQYMLYEFNPETNESHIVSKKNLIKLLKQ